MAETIFWILTAVVVLVAVIFCFAMCRISSQVDKIWEDMKRENTLIDDGYQDIGENEWQE